MTRHFGTLNITKRLPSSVKGNARFEVSVNGFRAVTKPNSSLVYMVENYKGLYVEAIIGTHRGKPTLAELRLRTVD